MGKIIPEEFSTNAYVKELYETEHVHSSTKKLRVILYAKYENADLHKFMETQCQRLEITRHNEVLKLLLRFEEFSMEHLAPGKHIQ